MFKKKNPGFLLFAKFINDVTDLEEKNPQKMTYFQYKK